MLKHLSTRTRLLLAGFVAVVVAVTGWTTANASTSSVAPQPVRPTASSATLKMPSGKQGAALRKAFADMRKEKPVLFKGKTDAQLLALLNSHITGTKGTQGATGIHPLVSGWGTGTLWFTRWDVAWYATAGTAAVVALILATGPISVAIAYGIAGGLIATFWSAYWSGYCAWFTYRTPRSWGTYRC